MATNPSYFQVTSQLRKPCWYNCLPVWSRETVIARLAIWSLPSWLCCPGEWSPFLNVVLPQKCWDLRVGATPLTCWMGTAGGASLFFPLKCRLTPGSYSWDLLPHAQNSRQGCLLQRCLSEQRGRNDLNSRPWETGYMSQNGILCCNKKNEEVLASVIWHNLQNALWNRNTKIRHTAQKLLAYSQNNSGNTREKFVR